MKKRLFALLTALCAVLLLTAPAFAGEYGMPDWYPEDVSGFQHFHNANAPRLVDEADLFTDAEEEEISYKLTALAQNHPESDFVVFTDVSSYGEDLDEYAADFFVFNGYGVGNDYNGMILFICMEPGNRGYWMLGHGASEPLFASDENIDHLSGVLVDYLRSGEYGAGVSRYLDEVDVLYTNGRFPRSSGANLLIIAGSLLIGLVAAAIVVGALKASLNNVSEATEANRYFVSHSLRLRRQRDYFLYMTENRVKREKERSSSHTTSSSGDSFSGGGGSF